MIWCSALPATKLSLSSMTVSEEVSAHHASMVSSASDALRSTSLPLPAPVRPDSGVSKNDRPYLANSSRLVMRIRPASLA